MDRPSKPLAFWFRLLRGSSSRWSPLTHVLISLFTKTELFKSVLFIQTSGSRSCLAYFTVQYVYYNSSWMIEPL
ncbi:hypothetical protein AT4G01915 [Arabidopsis thaliana]|uniref:Uncharacterized protein n=1 Tax=Arabidopsis thaliana TaxID=3702 RepID=F4JG76_ARATH|nr:uncharacterized protein AT4G01915 [Arabidopsis thaliana]NP_974496.1 uncharacterized protein AT4G01915 [Arabidopsis thaliana]NP_974497.1 uncharacterized protein AT4G01915 [Arabidopsis thaliana]AEE82096.1 hypothetical protein AT4G01915 [Arabidopsis thaliana]AEE82098.1 hypothetical protein AT4G01915 [Arabidopsis thaliana]ANM67013.1 hypothetical protein AT4G01915 [Arabidopsis thaliana]|eukprot:NP_001328870.1 hypothetical protein AT4G01915 [Arabidopsis thaliana]